MRLIVPCIQKKLLCENSKTPTATLTIWVLLASLYEYQCATDKNTACFRMSKSDVSELMVYFFYVNVYLRSMYTTSHRKGHLLLKLYSLMWYWFKGSLTWNICGKSVPSLSIFSWGMCFSNFNSKVWNFGLFCKVQTISFLRFSETLTKVSMQRQLKHSVIGEYAVNSKRKSILCLFAGTLLSQTFWRRYQLSRLLAHFSTSQSFQWIQMSERKNS